MTLNIRPASVVNFRDDGTAAGGAAGVPGGCATGGCWGGCAAAGTWPAAIANRNAKTIVRSITVSVVYWPPPMGVRLSLLRPAANAPAYFVYIAAVSGARCSSGVNVFCSILNRSYSAFGTVGSS